MVVQHETLNHKGTFFIQENGKRIASLEYVFAGDSKFIIEHTLVNPGNEGKGLGRQLVDAAVEFARGNHYKILPLCTYAKRVMEGSHSYKDVLF